jgi:hypothetical protein
MCFFDNKKKTLSTFCHFNTLDRTISTDMCVFSWSDSRVKTPLSGRNASAWNQRNKTWSERLVNYEHK